MEKTGGMLASPFDFTSLPPLLFFNWIGWRAQTIHWLLHLYLIFPIPGWLVVSDLLFRRSSLPSWFIWLLSSWTMEIKYMNQGCCWCIQCPSRQNHLPGYPLQYSCLEDSMDRGAWQATVHVFAKSWLRPSSVQTWLSNWHFHFHGI